MMRPNADGYSSENTDMVDSPDDPTAQNAATAATKPKAAVNVQPPMPALAPLNSGVDRYTGGEAVNNDPNAYQPPPQQMMMDPYAGGGGPTNGPPTSGGGMGIVPQPYDNEIGTDAGMALPNAPPTSGGGMGLPPEMTKPFGYAPDSGFLQPTDGPGLAPVRLADLITPQPLPQVSASGASMGGQNVPAPSNQVFNYIDPVSGEHKTAASSADVPGVAGRASAGLVGTTAGGNMSTEGDSANPFRGYVSAEGGGFGSGQSGTLESLRTSTGVDPAKFGFNAQTSPDEIQAASRVMASMANGDPAAMTQGLQSSNAFIRQTAANELAKGLTMSDSSQGAANTIQQLPPELRALVQKAFVNGNPYVAGNAGYDAKRGTGAQDALYADSWKRMIDKPISDKTDPAVQYQNLVMGLGGRISGQGDVGIPNGRGGMALEGNVNDPAFLAKVQDYAKGKVPQKIIQDAVAPPDPNTRVGNNFTPSGPPGTPPLLSPLPAKTASGATDATTGKPTNTAVTTGTGTATGTSTGTATTAGTTGTPKPFMTNAGMAQGTNAGVSGGFPQLTSSASGNAGISTTPTTADNALTNSTLARGPGADRFKIAGDQWDAFQKSSDPAYQASLRDANRMGAAAGGLGSGQLRTSLGDLASNRALQMDMQKQNFLSDALKGTIGDQFGDLNQANQQQGFQQGQQQQGFNNEVQKQTLQEMLTGGNFNRGLQALTAGGAANPADVQLLLSQIFGNNASAAGSSLSGLLGGLGKKSTSGGQ